MRIVQLGARRGAEPPAPGDAQLVHDILWAHAVPATRLEHLRVRAENGLLSLSFLLADDVADPLGEVLQLIATALTRSAYLADWDFTRTAPETPSPETPGADAPND